MKICHIISNKVWGGGEQYVYDLCDSLINDGYEVEIFVRPIKAIVEKVSKLGIPIHKLSFLCLIKYNNCIIHVHNFNDALKVALVTKILPRNIKIIITRHLVRQAKTSILYTWLYSRIDKIIFVSELARNEFLASHPIIDNKKICVVHNSIRPQKLFKQDNIRKKLSADTLVLMYHGRVAEEKGLSILVEAVSMLKDIQYHLFIIGTGDVSFKKKIQDQIDKCGITNHVSFLGFKDNVVPYIAQADIGILPSIVKEACLLSCMEYMCEGKLVITTNNGAQPEYITNGETGLLINPCSVDDLVNAICCAKECKDSIGENAQKCFAKELTYEKFYFKIKSIYGKLNLGY